jgi:type VI secretion system protein ImpE
MPPVDPSLRAGNLAETLAELQQKVRTQPSDPAQRVFLFQLLSVLGDWDRAMTQLQVAGELDPAALPMVQTYREALACEVLRAEIFAGTRTPLVFGEPEQWLALLLESLRLASQGRPAEAAALRGRAFADAPATRGSIAMADATGKEAGEERGFEWIADADTRLGPVLEAIVNGRYYWVPFQRIASIEIEAPADLRDLVWCPATFRWASGGEGVGLIPTRYAGTEAAVDDAIRLARRTVWNEPYDGAWLGQGQRLLATDGGEHPLLEVRRVRLETAAAAPAGAGAAGAGTSGG